MRASRGRLRMGALMVVAFHKAEKSGIPTWQVGMRLIRYRADAVNADHRGLGCRRIVTAVP